MAEEHATGGTGPADPAAREKAARVGLGRHANRSLRRARSIYDANAYEASVEADFLIREATVLALMDLADAIREQNP